MFSTLAMTKIIIFSIYTVTSTTSFLNFYIIFFFISECVIWREYEGGEVWRRERKNCSFLSPSSFDRCSTKSVVHVPQSVFHKNCCLCSTVCVAQELLSVLQKNCCLCCRRVVCVAEGVEEAGQSCEGTCHKAAGEVSGCRGNDREALRRTALQCSHISSHHMTLCIAWLHLHACDRAVKQVTDVSLTMLWNKR